MAQIGQLLGLSKHPVYRALKAHGIAARVHTSKYPQLNDADWLRDQYLTKHKSIKQIADEIDATVGTVHSAITHLGIKTRNPKESLAIKSEHKPIGAAATNQNVSRQRPQDSDDRLEAAIAVTSTNPTHTGASLKRSIDEILSDKSGIRLEIGGGANPNPGFVNIDMLPLPEVDIVWDLEETPWPLPDECALMVTASHVLEHINPHKGTFIRVMNEVWRVLKPQGQFAFVVPHGESPGFIQDPTHCNPMNETCVSPDTEVLTGNGFKLITSITERDDVLSLDPQSNQAEYVAGCKLTSFERKGEMVHFTGRAIDLLTNPSHRMWFATRKTATRFRFAEAKEFLDKNPNTTIFSSAIDYEGNGLTKFTIPKIQSVKANSRLTDEAEFPIDAFADFMGWYLSEGSCEVTKETPSSYRVHIAQVKPDHRLEIIEMVKQLGFKPIITPTSINFSAYSIAPWLKQFGLCDNKFIPRDLLNSPYSARVKLFESLMAGDGHWVKKERNQFQYSTQSKRLADDVQELAMKIGYRASVTSTMKQLVTGKTLYRVLGSRYSPIYARQFKKVEQYDGSVHSLDMPKNHIYMARRHGKCVWTGNTMHYFDPDPEGANIGQALYGFYRPKPWKIVNQYFSYVGNLEVLLEKRPLDRSYLGNAEPPFDITRQAQP